MLAAARARYLDEQTRSALRSPAAAIDIAYGDDPRHRLDIYRPAHADEVVPVLVWVHGGGFVRGEKSEPHHPYEAHFGRLAADNGYLGVVMNYRLAPAHCWPAGGDDVGAAVAWLADNAVRWGGDGSRVVLVGTSAGAAHIATFLQLRGDEAGVAGAVLLSGLFGYTELTDERRDLLYFGTDRERHLVQASGPALEQTATPLFVTCAEHDPERFQAEYVALIAGRLRHRAELPPGGVVQGHDHFSQAYHLGTRDSSLTDEIMAFAGRVTRR